MDEIIKKKLVERNNTIIEAIKKKADKVCPGAIDLIGICGSFSTGDIHEKSDLDLCIVINSDEGWKVGSCFILGDVAHDIYCTPWGSLEELAEVKMPYIAKLLDMKIIYSADDKALERCRGLQKKALEILSAPLCNDDIERAKPHFEQAALAYSEVMLSESYGDAKYASAKMLYMIEQGLYTVNKAYVKVSVRKMFDEVCSLQKLPENFCTYYKKLIDADSMESVIKASTDIMRSVRKFFTDVQNSFTEKGQVTSDGLRGSYEEIFSNWRNKMYLAAETGNKYLSLMTNSSCQFLYDDLYSEVEMPKYDIFKDFDINDLEKSAQNFDKVMDEYRQLYVKTDTPVVKYDTIDEFLKDYLK